MAGDTEVLPLHPTGTTPLPLLGVHPLNPQRCVVEVSLRLFGITPLRVRLPAATGQLAVADADGAPIGALRLELSATPTMASVPLVNRLLRGAIPGSYRLVIILPGIELFGGSAAVRADGTVSAKSLARPADTGPDATLPHLTDTEQDLSGQAAEGSAPADSSTVRWPLRFLVRSIQSTEPAESDVVLLAMSGRLRQPRKRSEVSPVLSLLRPWIRVETAAEFTR